MPSISGFARSVPVLLLAVAFFLAQGGSVVWQSLRVVTYHCLRPMTKHRDITLIIPVSELTGHVRWVRHDEISYKGRMFDIRTRKQTTDHLVLTGHFDRKDDQLFKWLRKLLDDESPGTRKSKLRIWTCEAIPVPWQAPILVQVASSALPRSSRPSDACCDGFLSRFVPPPEPLS